MMKKIKDTSGETITEVLVASLVVVLGVLLYAMMVQSSSRIMNTSERKMLSIYKAESSAVQREVASMIDDGVGINFNNDAISGKGLVKAGDIPSTVTIYGDDESDIMLYYADADTSSGDEG